MEDSRIKRKAITGSLWKFSERAIAQGISLIVSIILARLLTPADYGVVSIVAIFFTFANVIISGGLNTALIQKKDADALDYSSILYLSLIASLAIYIVFYLTAPNIADIYSQPALTKIIRVMGLSLPIYALKSVYCAYISSNLKFKTFFFATLGGTLTSAVIGITLAYHGAGAWALVAQQISNTLIDTVILIAVTRMPLVLQFSVDRVKSLFGYGSRILVSSLIGTIYTELNPMFIGIKYSSADLSFYTKGKMFPSTLSQTMTSTLSAVLFPVLSKKQEDKSALLRYTRLYMRTASFLVFPTMMGLFAVSTNFVRVLLTEKWIAAAYFIRIFCIASMFDVVAIGNCETIKAMGRSDIYLKMEIIKKTGYFVTIGLFLLISKNPNQIALSAIVCTIIQIVVNSIPNQRLIGYSIKDQISDLLPNLFLSIVMGIVVYLIGYIHLNALLLLFVQIICGVAFYYIANIICKNPSMKYAIDQMKTVIGR